MSWKYLVQTPERQHRDFQSLKEQTELSIAELMRRMFDHCLQTNLMNEIVPNMSGRLTVGKS